MTSTIEIYDQDGDNPITGGAGSFDFDPVPNSVSWRMDNSPGKINLDFVGSHRPSLFYSRSGNRKLTIKTILLGTSFTSQPILNWLDDLTYIMSGASSTYLYLHIPFSESYSGTPHSYSGKSTDYLIDNAMFVTGQDYFRVTCHPDGMTIDKITPNACYITLEFTEIYDTVIIG